MSVLRLIHTADWHLGHRLHGVSRAFEHEQFLAWLSDCLVEVSADALIVAGDVFDSANPPASAQELLYRFLRDAKQRTPNLDVVLIAGNHDSASRLTAPGALLEAFDVRVVGKVPFDNDDEMDWKPLLVPLRNRDDEIAVWCGAMPFLRNADLPALRTGDQADPLIAGVRQRYEGLISALRERAGDIPMVLTGHCYMASAQVSELSERKILGGNQHALPLTLFPDDIQYVALGHLHRAQSVGGRDNLRYSGSPIPLSLDEADYTHQVLQVDLEPSGEVRVDALPIPRTVDIIRIPEQGALSLENALNALEALDSPARDQKQLPFLQVQLRLDQPQPDLRQQLEQAVEGKPVRLLKVAVEYPGTGGALGDTAPSLQLDDLDPDQVFLQRYAQSFDEDPSATLMDAFHELVGDVREHD